MKVKFIGYEMEYDIPDPWFTVGKIYNVILDRNDCSDAFVIVKSDEGLQSPMFASEYEIIEP